MATSIRLFAATLLVALIGASTVGCDRGDSAPSSSTPPAAGPGETASKDSGDDGAADDAGNPDDADAAGQTPAPPKAAAASKTPTPDAALPPSVDGEPVKAGFIFYVAKDKPAPLAAFHQKDLEAKGWKLGRNDSGPLAGTTLVGIVQEYTKGNEVITVGLAEQVATEGNLTMASLMDIPLPPKAKVVTAFPYTVLEVPDSSEATVAWFQKELGARGWTAGRQNDSGASKAVTFKKAGRTLQPVILPLSGKTSTQVQLMHMAPYE